MSKSAANPNSRILLSDSKDEIEIKIRKAVTDSETDISYDPVLRPGISNLLCILHECRRLSAPVVLSPQTVTSYLPCSTGSHSPTSKSPCLGKTSDISGTPGPTPHLERSPAHGLTSELSELSKSFDGMQTPQFKEAVVHAVEACIGPIRAEFQKIRSDESYIRQVTRDGAVRARQIAVNTISEVKAKIGLD
jgi:tryptophanyl-tRNA synthetase